MLVCALCRLVPAFRVIQLTDRSTFILLRLWAEALRHFRLRQASIFDDVAATVLRIGGISRVWFGWRDPVIGHTLLEHRKTNDCRFATARSWLELTDDTMLRPL
jgi:hypothetical protein